MSGMRTVRVMAMFAALAMAAQGCGGMEDGAQVDAAARGASLPDGTIVMDGDRAFLKGIVTAKSTATLTIGGYTVDIGAAQFRDGSDAAVTAEEFLGLVTLGVTRVKVRWEPFTSASAPVEQAEIDLD